MYRGLTATNQQVGGDRYGRSTTTSGIAASTLPSSSNATSNGEYGGWFGHGSSSISHPTFSRAKSETIWRTGNGPMMTGNTASIQDIMQLLKQGQTPRPVIASVTRSGPNGLRLVGGGGSRGLNGSVVQQGSPSLGMTDPGSNQTSSSQGNHLHNGGGEPHLATNGGDGSHRRWPAGSSSTSSSAEVPNGDATPMLTKVGNGVLLLQQQQSQQQQGQPLQHPRGFVNPMPGVVVHQRLAPGSLLLQHQPPDQHQIRLLKSATTLGFAPTVNGGVNGVNGAGSSSSTVEQNNNRNFASSTNFKNSGSNVPAGSNRNNIYNAGPVPIWRNRWSQGRPPQYRLGGGQSATAPHPGGLMMASDAVYRPETAAHLNTAEGGSNMQQGTGQLFNMADNNGGRPVAWQTTSTGTGSQSSDDVSSAVLANRLREDRTHFNPERGVVSKVETVTAVDLLQTPPAVANAKQRPPVGLYNNSNNFSSEENPASSSKYGRYGGLGSAAGTFDRSSNVSSSSYPPPKLVHDGFRSDGPGTTVPPSQLDHDNKVAKSHFTQGISEESFVRSPGYATISGPRLGTNSAAQGPASSPRLGAQGPVVSSPRLGTHCAAQGPGFNTSPRRSILKKPKIHSTDYESGINAKRRMDLYPPMRHSAGTVGCFNGFNGHAGQAVPAGAESSFQNRRQDSNQKRVTFKLDQ